MRSLIVVAGAFAIAACQRGHEPVAVDIVTYQCDGIEVAAVFRGEDTVELDVDGKPLKLPRAVSASGARYADASGNEFWSKGTSFALLTLAGEPRRSCGLPGTLPGTANAAPQARGPFTAIGQEPGWRADVSPGTPARLSASLDYGNRRIEVAKAAATATGWNGPAADGTAVTPTVTRKACKDRMSGEAFEAEATLTVADQSWSGCGRFNPDAAPPTPRP